MPPVRKNNLQIFGPVYNMTVGNDEPVRGDNETGAVTSNVFGSKIPRRPPCLLGHPNIHHRRAYFFCHPNDRLRKTVKNCSLFITQMVPHLGLAQNQILSSRDSHPILSLIRFSRHLLRFLNFEVKNSFSAKTRSSLALPRTSRSPPPEIQLICHMNEATTFFMIFSVTEPTRVLNV